MLVLPVDALMLMTPMLWAPDQYAATIAMTVLSLFFIVDRGRYHARLHISVLDELPSLLSSLLTAAAIVATVIALLPGQAMVTDFLQNAAIAIALVVAGRILTSQMIIYSRRRRMSHHRTVLIGGGPTSAELIRILRQHKRYGLSVVGFVDDTDDSAAGKIATRLGNLSDLDEVVVKNRADVLLVADCCLAGARLSSTTSAHLPARTLRPAGRARGCTTSHCRPAGPTTSARSRSSGSVAATCAARRRTSSGLSTSSSRACALILVSPVLGGAAPSPSASRAGRA